MPWTPAQHRLFEAAAHNPQIAQAHHLSQSKAAGMASEGVKGPGLSKRAKPDVLATVLRKMNQGK